MDGHRSLRSHSTKPKQLTNAAKRKKTVTPATVAKEEEPPVQNCNESDLVSPEVGPKRRKMAPEIEANEPLPVVRSKVYNASGPLGEIPLDILSEIFGHLQPVSLLALLRTGHFLRAFLLNRSLASPIWKSVGPF
jgi:hypothetical protein